MTTGPTNLAQEAFWEDDYLGGVTLPARPDPAFGFERTLMEAFAAHAPAARGARVLEIGCAPAKWLAFYAERYGAHPTGIEYTARGAALSRANLAAVGVAGEVIEGDFFAVEPAPYDLVLSLGFIEHFDDLGAAFAHHAAFVGPGGTLVVGVPNYRGLIGTIQRWTDPAHLELHNLAAMDPALYRRLAPANGLAVTWQGHLNGPDPALLKLGRRSALPVIVALEQLRRVDASRHWNRPGLSSYLLTVFRRPAA